MATRKVYKLSDKSVILGTELEVGKSTITIGSPVSLTQVVNPQSGEPEIAFLPMDLIFADVIDTKDNFELNVSHIMWQKDMADFPSYEQNYIQTTTGIETVSSGIIKG